MIRTLSRAGRALGCFFVVAAFLSAPATLEAITIGRTFGGGTQPDSSSGAGNVTDIFNAAADWWEMAIRDPGVVNMEFGWGALDEGKLGVAFPTGGSGGPPAPGGTIVFDNDGTSDWFLDLTPHNNVEWATAQQSSTDLGGGVVNTGRSFSGYTGPLVGDSVPHDLLTVAKHEIGHLLGFLEPNNNWGDPITITAPRPLPGTMINTTAAGGGHIEGLPGVLMSPSLDRGIRKVQSAVDILGVAQLNNWRMIDLDPKAKLTTVAKWSQPFIPEEGENIPSSVDWRDVMRDPAEQQSPNWVVADDFISDGRPITAVRWWGSYFNPDHEPWLNPNTGAWEATTEDGFAISFHADDVGTVPGTLLGSYIADVSAVKIRPTLEKGWDEHAVWEYEVELEWTHGDHLIPGLSEEDAFLEEAGVQYWLSITAENGHELDPSTWEATDNGDPLLEEHFWGWHTSLGPILDSPVMGDLNMPDNRWQYGNWTPIDPIHFGTEMAFELLTPIPEPGTFALALLPAAAALGTFRRRRG